MQADRFAKMSLILLIIIIVVLALVATFWDFIVKNWQLILAIAIIMAFVFAPQIAVFLGPTTLFGSAFAAVGSWGVLASSLVGLGSAFVIVPDGAAEVVTRVSDGAQQIAEAAGETVGSALSGFVSSDIGTWLLIGLGAFAAYKIFFSGSGSSENKDQNTNTNTNTNTNQVPYMEPVLIGGAG